MKANGVTFGAKKKKKTSELPHHYEGENSRKWNLAEKSKHSHSNEPNLQTKIKTHLISSALLKEVTKPKIYRNTNINNRTKTHLLVSKTRQNRNEKIHKLKQKWWGRWPWLVLGPLLDIWWMQCFFFPSYPIDPHSAFDEWDSESLRLWVWSHGMRGMRWFWVWESLFVAHVMAE